MFGRKVKAEKARSMNREQILKAIRDGKTLRNSVIEVVNDKEVTNELKKEFGIDEKKLFVVYNGIDTVVFKPDERKREFVWKKFSLDEKDKVLLMAGVIHKQKGMHIGLRAFVQIKKKISEAKMMIVGNGPQLESLKIFAKKLNIEDDVIFCGFIPNEEVSSYCNAADLFLNPTVRVEGHPIVVIEAMACSKPVVISRIGGTQSTIDDGVSGFFVKPKV